MMPAIKVCDDCGNAHWADRDHDCHAMTPEDRIRQALKVTETGAMMQFNKDSQFAQALRDVLAKLEKNDAEDQVHGIQAEQSQAAGS